MKRAMLRRAMMLASLTLASLLSGEAVLAGDLVADRGSFTLPADQRLGLSGLDRLNGGSLAGGLLSELLASGSLVAGLLAEPMAGLSTDLASGDLHGKSSLLGGVS